jgi:UPF0042 nucleotide-binding protein
MSHPGSARRIVLVTGLSGGGKASALRSLEDLGFDAVDNPPLPMLEEMVSRSARKLAVGVDARTSGFDASRVLAALGRLKDHPGLRPELIYMAADETTLLRRSTESRRRHPLAPQGLVADGVAADQALTAPLREAADLVIDTSDLSLPALRALFERHYGHAAGGEKLMLSLMSFGFPRGLPKEADLVFDARFLRNPHYDPILRPLTGLDPSVAAYIEADPDCGRYFGRIAGLVDLVLPRFVQEGKKYATITIGCTGGRHRSVYLVEKLANHLLNSSLRAVAGAGEAKAGEPRAAPQPAAAWRLHVSHRELTREPAGGISVSDHPSPRRDGLSLDAGSRPVPAQAQEA